MVTYIWVNIGSGQAIIWSNVDLSLMNLRGIHLEAISQQMSKLLFSTISLKIILLELLPHLPGPLSL